MQAKCPHCGAVLHTEAPSGEAPSSCWMCKQPVAPGASPKVVSPPTIALHKKPQRRGGAILVPKDSAAPTKSLVLPHGKRITLVVIEGASQGQEFDVSRPLMTIGRAGGGADIEIDDPEASRSHCAVEVRRETVMVHDLRSTNGTYVGTEKILAAQIEPMGTFRVGDTTLQIRVEG